MLLFYHSREKEIFGSTSLAAKIHRDDPVRTHELTKNLQESLSFRVYNDLSFIPRNHISSQPNRHHRRPQCRRPRPTAATTWRPTCTTHRSGRGSSRVAPVTRSLWSSTGRRAVVWPDCFPPKTRSTIE